MNHPIRIAITGLAMRKAEEAALWHWERSGERVGGRLLAEIERARRILRDQPGIGTPGERGTRKSSLGRFPYSLVYRIDDDTVRVIAFMHQRRRPGYWAHRR